MDLFTGFVVFFLIWWLVIFCVLPWGIHRDNGEFGGSGAPAHPNLKKKFLITTGISILLWVLVYGLIRADVVDFRAFSRKMVEEDYK